MSSPVIAEDAARPLPAPTANPFVHDMPETEEIITALPVDHFGTTVYVKAWRHIHSKRSPVILIHDIAEHSDLYLETARLLLAGGYSVYLFDLRGHGRSGRQLGHAPSFAALVKDLLQVAAWVRYEEGGRPPVLLGQGIGSLIATEFTKRHSAFCRAVILSAPCFELAAQVTAPRRFILKVLADLSPMLRIPILLKPRLSRGVALLPAKSEEATQTHRFPGLTAVFTQELLLAIKRAETSFIDYTGAVLILCPDKDAVCHYTTLKKAAAVHREHNVEIVDLHGTSHRVFTSDSAAREKAVGEVLTWLARLEPAPVV